MKNFLKQYRERKLRIWAIKQANKNVGVRSGGSVCHLAQNLYDWVSNTNGEKKLRIWAAEQASDNMQSIIGGSISTAAQAIYDWVKSGRVR